MAGEPSIEELVERIGAPPGGPPPTAISRDDWWAMMKRIQELEAFWRGQREEEQRQRAECGRRLQQWQIAFATAAGLATALLATLLSFLFRT